MHLLATTSGVIDGAADAIDLKQTPGDIVVLSAADSELANLARAADTLDLSNVRLANVLHLQHNYSVDLYAEQTLAHAKFIVVRLLGGRSYWRYGIDTLEALARDKKIDIVVLPGGTERDEELSSASTIPAIDCERLRQYLAVGGPENAVSFLKACTKRLYEPVTEFGAYGTYFATAPKSRSALVVFYRSMIEGGQTAPIDALIASLVQENMAVTALYVSSLKDAASASHIRNLTAPDIVINATSFAVGEEASDPLRYFDCPVLQVSLAGSSETQWQGSAAGLNAKDLAMSVVLPELDGRIYTRAISFKTDQQMHARTECRIVTYKPRQDRIDFVSKLASNWALLRHVPNSEKRVAIILANYPDKDGRIANGVGYDTPASTIAILQTLNSEGYDIEDMPDVGNTLIEALQQKRHGELGEALTLENYVRCFNGLPESVQSSISERWGVPTTDPSFKDGCFHFTLLRFGNVVVGIQPARGYNIDPKATYHDPALVPPHGYMAFYFYLRHQFKAHAIIHNGKHGNLEWLPGKATASSDTCFPETALGPMPHIYPFIVNDPGEGTQAKRRTSAVIVDHLTPPLTRAESYGPLKDLEALVDEYYLASGLDRRRMSALKSKILDLTRSTRLDQDAGFTGDEESDLQKLDAYLCDLKEAQIRDGLHILGAAPEGQRETDLLVALTRTSRRQGDGADKSLIRSLADDFMLGFDPLDCDFAAPWTGPRPETLSSLSSDAWRTAGDTVERLEILATQLVKSSQAFGHSTQHVLNFIKTTLRPLLKLSGQAELAAIVRTLNGRNLAPGPSGAPTRGRLDVLPTGRNFYSIDCRTLPTPTAWTLGQASAQALLTRHFQDTGQHLVSAALSAWGTSNMRTGGDDIAQALTLIGARPVWDPTSWRVTGFDVIPLPKLGRPRVDVTLRISGFFRDAFPSQIELLDKAIHAIAALDEDEADNPLAARTRKESAMLVESGANAAEAAALAGHRIFGSKPGAYGAGLQALIDERIWETRADLAAAFVTWGAYAYGAKAQGINSEDAFRRRLASIEAVIHNQDNREHDLLDSDDYYQFEGGLSAAVETATGKKPRAYHNDHSRPERPVVRTLDEEIARVVRSRVVNPKWITGVKRHGYKGAFEIAATVDYMFAFAATADAVKSHHFDLAYEAYLIDDDTRQFIMDNNPAALKEIAARFEEAIARGLWQPRLNSAYDHLKDLQHDR